MTELTKHLLIVTAICGLLALLLIVSPGARTALRKFDAAGYEYMHGYPPRELTWEERKQYGYLSLMHAGFLLAMGAGYLINKKYRNGTDYFPVESRFTCSRCKFQHHISSLPRSDTPKCPQCGRWSMVRPKPIPWWKTTQRALVIVCVLISAESFGDEPDNGDVYDRTVGSVVYITAIDRNWNFSYGAGIVIDEKRGDILTAYHVVGEDRLVSAVPPDRNADGQVITDSSHYENIGPNARCIVIGLHKSRDLGLIRFLKPRSGLKGLSLSPKGATPGQSVFGVGHGAGMLFRYTGGAVRSVGTTSYTATDGLKVTARVISTSLALDGGDSGGALISRTGELVGVMVATREDAKLVSNAIDVSEVREFIKEIRLLRKEN